MLNNITGKGRVEGNKITKDHIDCLISCLEVSTKEGETIVGFTDGLFFLRAAQLFRQCQDAGLLPSVVNLDEVEGS